MIFTPEERRAALAVIFLLAVGEILSLWHEWKEQQPDRELSAWLSHLDSLDIGSDLAGDVLPPEGARAGTAAESVRTFADTRPEAWPEAPLEDAPPGILDTGKLRINEAEAAALESLPGVGPALAERILHARSAGPFLVPSDLLRVKGIGPKKLESLRPWIDWSPPGGLQGEGANGTTP